LQGGFDLREMRWAFVCALTCSTCATSFFGDDGNSKDLSFNRNPPSPVMPATIDQPQTEINTNEDLRLIEGRLDQLSDMLEPESNAVTTCETVDGLKLGNYRLDIAKVIDQAMAETAVWWVPENA
jgi:hypothetical protein